MSAHQRFEEALRRIATIPSIVRTRREDEGRIARHGGLNGHLDARVAGNAAALEATAAEMEEALS